MDKDQKPDLVEEAAMIFLAVSEDPEDADLAAERDQFLAKGEAHRQAYKKVEDGWRVAGGRSRSQLRLLLPFLLALGAASYFTLEPLRIYVLADFSTGTEARQNTLVSGDLAYLDAGSALADHTRSGARSTELLRGSAYFEVEPGDRPFVVSVGPARVTVVGTAFEAALMHDGVYVSVAEGIVDVSVSDQDWQLKAGDHLLLRDQTTAEKRNVDVSSVATWRGDQLVVDDMTIRQVAAVLDRRITGEVLVTGGSWAEASVSGTFDLDDPGAALKALAIIGNARLISAAPVVTILMPRE